MDRSPKGKRKKFKVILDYIRICQQPRFEARTSELENGHNEIKRKEKVNELARALARSDNMSTPTRSNQYTHRTP